MTVEPPSAGRCYGNFLAGAKDRVINTISGSDYGRHGHFVRQEAGRVYWAVAEKAFETGLSTDMKNGVF
jgi:hypothetical protein